MNPVLNIEQYFSNYNLSFFNRKEVLSHGKSDWIDWTKLQGSFGCKSGVAARQNYGEWVLIHSTCVGEPCLRGLFILSILNNLY